jgi:dinuclear metal center YbgI/SA1388 family protein
MKIRELTQFLEQYAPLAFQEEYDNSGLIIGDPEAAISKVLITLDVTEKVLDEAVEKKCSLVVAHHPLIFRGLKRLTGQDLTQRLTIKAIRNNIAVYAMHTNLDNAPAGLNKFVCDILGLVKCSILSPAKGMLEKLVTFCPVDHAERVRQALFDAGAGHIGKYDCCSYNLSGQGTFRASEEANPYVGEKNALHYEPEIRTEVILPRYLEDRIITALRESHPYEEVAFDLYPLYNTAGFAGSGMTGELNPAMDQSRFIDMVKQRLGLALIRHTDLSGDPVERVAVCTGSGAFLIPEAKRSGAGAFLTADLKYHDFFEATPQFLLADIGHYESERFAKDLIYGILIKKFPTFAFLKSEIETNPVHYH